MIYTDHWRRALERGRPVMDETSQKLEALIVTEPLLQFFSYQHLKPELQGISQYFAELAIVILTQLPRNPERTTALRKLMEAKDCAVRAKLYRTE